MVVQHIKLARERRKRKSRIKAAIFFAALLSIFSGLLLHLKDNVEDNVEQITSVNDSGYEKLHSSLPVTPSHTAISLVLDYARQNSRAILGSEADNDATSYDDDLSGDDDEVDQIDLDGDELALDELPKDAQDALNDLLDAADQAKRITDQFSHTIVRGDSLKDVLELSGLDAETANKLIKRYPELKSLKAGQQMYWILDRHSELEYLNWLVSEKEERIYERGNDGNFRRQVLEKKSTWKKEVLKGKVTTSLRAGLQKLGLDRRQIGQLTTALQWQLNMAKLRAGDEFALLISREYVGDKLTGQGNVEAIHIITQGKSYYAIQAENGRYYNRQGETLGKGFARYPIQRQARVSSPFNPRRRHPVTGRIRPHKGVDFALPSGTPVIAPADGIVEKVAYQRGGAGRYIIIRHGREYQTVYMHLSKPLVRAGQSVKRGERIALSGNTGISTGAHLHYEFHINGRPVNPLTVKLPGNSSGMRESERRKFLVVAKAAERRLKLN
ncbi:murein DD-endopeptidase MepM/ murein hydrolase activator NlpD [Mesocricetibacter intestinalis]|uniref:Murein DD-endopeptidase MepM/ murein hydrolase activator NlpD n=1 Tax=Mesocricetibacter intestinalis TaxID=1521930 RepID=A0A4V3DA43_9PAST|nr:murein DD-endopeptidase MepM [Mesocricetibacter intestinalis]TDQ59843.1 murein DD-endopeptidase MepM/ murein hydrolase activator NlpD [Mesocricetibacter intestinalis]